MGLDAIGIISKNISKSIEFYKHFGIKLAEVGGPGHYEAQLPSGLRIMLDSIDLVKQINPDWKEPTGPGIVLCFKQDSATQVDELFNTLTQAGYKSVKEPWNAFWGQRYSSVEDPDGYQIDIFATP